MLYKFSLKLAVWVKNQLAFVIRSKSGSKFWMKVGFYLIRRIAFLQAT